MTPTELIDRYRVVLQERFARMEHALERYRAALTELLPACGLPDPQVVDRVGYGSGRDLSTVAWRQEVPAARATGATTVVVRVEFTVSLTGFHCTVRDPRDEKAPVLYDHTQREYELPRIFVDLARKLAEDPALPRARWDATIYTF